MKKHLWLASLAAVALYGASIGALNGWEHRYPVAEYLSVPPASTTKAMGSGYDNMMADGLYLQFINYFGKHVMRDRKYHNVMPVLDVITDLDPTFKGAYYMGSLALGDAGRYGEIETLMAKSVKAMPDDWQVAYDAGMALFVFGDTPEQYMKAAEYFRTAASLPGAAPKAAFMLARCYHVSDRRDLAIKIWQDTYDHSPSAEARKVAESSLKRLGVRLPAENKDR